jgi:hypothetical protein
LTKGSVIAFDELNCEDFPGETLAVLEVLDLSRYSIKRTSFNPTPSYVVVECLALRKFQPVKGMSNSSYYCIFVGGD